MRDLCLLKGYSLKKKNKNKNEKQVRRSLILKQLDYFEFLDRVNSKRAEM